jgi:hypothetical protein
MSTIQLFKFLLLFAFLFLDGLAISEAEPHLTIAWSIDLKKTQIKYSIKNEDITPIRFSEKAFSFTTPDDQKSTVSQHISSPAYMFDGVIHPYFEIITHPLKDTRIDSNGGIIPPPIEIKPGETRDFSYSLADSGLFNAGPVDLTQIESVGFQLALNGKSIYCSSLDYTNGKWNVHCP